MRITQAVQPTGRTQIRSVTPGTAGPTAVEPLLHLPRERSRHAERSWKPSG